MPVYVFQSLVKSESLSDSFDKIVGNFDALLAGFADTVFPENPIAGLRAFVNGAWHTYNGTAWKTDPELHNHDDRYYTEAEINSALSLKSDTSHGHSDLMKKDADSNLNMNGYSISFPVGTETVGIKDAAGNFRIGIGTDGYMYFCDTNGTAKAYVDSNGNLATINGAKFSGTATNAELLQSYAPAFTTSANTIPIRDGAGDIYANIFQGTAVRARYA